INEVNKEIRSIKNMKKRVLKRGDFAPENEVLELEGKTIRDIDDVDTKKPKNKIYKFSNGDVYVGKFLEGKMEGKGSYTFFVDEGTVMEYIGEFKEDKKNGKGNFIFSNGNEYIGYFEEDMMSGIGNMLYSSKDEYIGTWKNGKKDGKGIYKWSDGCIYAGEFKGGKMEGYGICYNSKGEVLYEGEWKNNLIHGKGTYIWEKGKKYIGEFMHGKKHGQGTFYLNNELVYEGTWKFDKPSIFDRTLDEIFSLRL
ncbi:hypothetical protein D1N78_11470, partial [Clostridioides difficile]